MTGIKKRSISLSGHRTSYSIEDEFYKALVEMARRQSISLAGLVARVDSARATESNLSSALRVAVLGHFRSAATINLLPESQSTEVSSNPT